MDRLVVDYTTLEACGSTAKQIKGGFEDLPSRVGDTSGVWGHHRIADAMHTFGSNWGYHREVLAEEIGEVGDKAEKCLQAFEDGEKKLAEAVREQAGGH